MNSHYAVERAAPGDATKALSEIRRLRYRIYVEEMNLPLAHDGLQLNDAVDDYSTSLLLKYQGQPVGTIRVTDRRAGPLEIEQQDADWNRRVVEVANSVAGRVGDVTRFMAVKEVRGTSVPARLIWSALNELRAGGIHIALGAAKVGPMNRYYARYGAVIDKTYRCNYRALRHTFGAYHLMSWNLHDNFQTHCALLTASIDRLGHPTLRSG